MNISQEAIDETAFFVDLDRKEALQKIEQAKFNEFCTAIHEIEIMAQLMGLETFQTRIAIIKDYLTHTIGAS